MMKWTFLTGLFILATSSGFAQDEESLERWIPYSNTSSIGANAGFTTGVGFSFRHFHNKDGYQITFIPVIDADNSFVSLGTTYLRKITQKKEYDFLFYASHHYNYYDDRSISNLGAGVGFNFHLSKDFHANVMAGYAAYDILSDIKSYPTIETGIFYRFHRK